MTNSPTFCARCGTRPKYRSLEMCKTCQEQTSSERRLQAVIDEYKPASDYNKYVFDLLVTYLRRYQVLTEAVQQARFMRSVLEARPIAAYLCWQDVYDFEEELMRSYDKSALKHLLAQGSAVVKIGSMLQELGVIEPRSTMRTRQLRKLMGLFDQKTQKILGQFSENARRLKRTDTTIIHYLQELRDLQSWLKTRGSASLFSINSMDMQLYLEHLGEKHSGDRRRLHNSYHCYNRFYNWCVLKKKVFTNPCADVLAPRMPPLKHTICSDLQLKRLLRFIKDPASEPEQAFLLALILFWGTTTEELTRAELNVEGDLLRVHFKERQISYRNHNRRDKLLTMPSSPEWIAKLQKRFYRDWCLGYQKLRKSFPGQPLFMDSKRHFNRKVSREWIRMRIEAATTTATGSAIPGFVLRQTCGRLYTKGHDASLLRELGWSSGMAFAYTWVPCTFHVPKKPRKRT